MKNISIAIMALGLIFAGYRQVRSMEHQQIKEMPVLPQNARSAVFAGGCFWCTESDFEKVDGVIEAISGYTGGQLENPTYKQVSAGGTAHVEAVKVIYDPDKVSYRELLDVFWKHIDPTDPDGQFVDQGPQYRSVIFYAGEMEKQMAQESRKKLAASGRFSKPIATEILPLGVFYPAEAYHQNYYKKNLIRYNWYRSRSGRDQFLKKTWAEKNKKMPGDMIPTAMSVKERTSAMMANEPMYTVPSDAELRRRLSPMQYKIIRLNGTEPPFNNTYWDNHQAGIYVDIASGEPLFSSNDKFESGTGWPSFTRPLAPENIVEKTDRSLFMVRTEVRSRHADSHLGHLFEDGPPPTGLRYCINSAALRFIPKEALLQKGYGKYLNSFK